ncbi:ATP-binding cassette domain-containing protein [Acidianus infernus]|uniref:ATP-binding cassette domain-containing protein n=1 Tax=Acidianus infernus TaxID=12915 RepID=A0A6A9QLW6_ACIIN|nr:ATP-binding cassette domain-containing protein [Acidianus infernus]MUM64908.1 ATP-binding cassette domain-containing protein [Acidianus infernus]
MITKFCATSLLRLRKVYILEGKDITVIFKTKKGEKIALNNVSVNISNNENISIIGESGSGKTTLSLVLAGVQKPNKGNVLYNGKNVYKLKGKEYKEFRRSVQYIMQNPYSAFNPFRKVSDSFKTVISEYKLAKGNEADNLIDKYLQMVGLDESIKTKYPHQLSGGQLQRAALARALLLKPKILFADEVVSMLDASLRIDIINLLKEIRETYNISIILITHDIGIAKYFSEDRGRIIVMYDGKIIEEGYAEEIIKSPKNEYTKLLLESYLDPFR